MQRYKLIDPNISESLKQNFHFQLGQQVCPVKEDGTPNLEDRGEIVDGERTENSPQGGSYGEKYRIKRKTGGFMILDLIQITESK